MRVVPVPCLRDNYAYLVVGDDPHVAAVVDPSEDGPVRDALAREGLRLGAILLTHHHFDHVGGVPGLLEDHPGVAVVAGEDERAKIATVTRGVEHEERFMAAGLDLVALHIPGHTLGAVAFVVYEAGSPRAVFSGDTLFCAGCGRLFEGTPAMMHTSLSHVLGGLPDATLVYPGHEYTAANLAFAAVVEPDSVEIAERAARVATLRARGEASVPSTLWEERATNPFLRVDEPAVRRFSGLAADAASVDVFAAVRKAKDAF